jgi:adenosylcobinamide hydrolase
MFACSVADDVLQVRRPGTRWLSTGPGGGFRTADAAYNCTVPEGFDRTDLSDYVAERRRAAGFEGDGPAMLTGVAMRHARRARLDPVEVIATAGLSNPAALPVRHVSESDHSFHTEYDTNPGTGTVNLVVGTTRALDDGALATALATAVEAKAATLERTVGFSGTTSDAVVVGADQAGDPAEFAGSATGVGRAVRVCVRDAVLASLDARYDGGDPPESVGDAEYGTVTTGQADVSAVVDD